LVYDDPQPPPPGFTATLLAALAAALTVGLFFGLADALVADVRNWPPTGMVGYLGCYAAAVMSYCALGAALLLPAGLVLHPFLARHGSRVRLRRLLVLGITMMAEIYWWTRPYVFYGHSSVSPERLGAALVQGLVAWGLALVAARLLLRLPTNAHRAIRLLALACVVGGLFFVRSEAALVENRGALNDRNRDLPNVMLVIVDALRADHLACYGSERVATPNIDALAERGVLLENCFAQAPYTWTSFGSILTGKYPRKHGLVAQKPGAQMEPNVTLPYHLKTAQLKGTDERLRDIDYAAGTFMTGALSHGSGLARGFDAYSEAMMGHDLVQMDSQWSRFRSELLLWLFKNKLQQRVDSSLVVTTARGWLREHRDRRWMAMVHLYSTHTPYDPPGEFKDDYLDPTYAGPIESFYAEHRYALEEGKYEPTDADVERIRDLYAAGTAQADAMIGELVAELDDLGVLEDTLILVTSDHGEDLGEWRPIGAEGDSTDTRYWEHNHMWGTNLRVPMVMANTRLLPHGKRITELVETIDFLPTICDLLGLELPTEDGVMEVDGQSFLPLILGVERGETDDYVAKRYTYCENNFFISIQDVRHKLIVPRLLLLDEDAEALFASKEWVRLYDLERDPEESVNIFSKGGAELRRLWEALREYDSSMPEPKYRMTERDREQVQMLKNLGYAGGIDPGANAEDSRKSEEDEGN